MASMNEFTKEVESLRDRTKVHVDGIKAFGEALSQEAESLNRQDQATRLESLKVKITQKVEIARFTEAIASYGLNNKLIANGLFSFGFGCLLGAVLKAQDHPLLIGAKFAVSSIATTLSYDTVVVRVGNGGIPDDVEVIALSSYARKQCTSESEARAVLHNRGYSLFEPEDFLTRLEEYKAKVLQGERTLPIYYANVRLRPTEACYRKMAVIAKDAASKGESST